MKPTGLLVLMPTRGAVAIETLLCIDEHLRHVPHELFTAYRLPVVTARNLLAKWACEVERERMTFEPNYVLWLDDDVWFTKEHVETAMRILRKNATVDAVTSLGANRCAYSDSNAIMPNDYQRSIAPLSLSPGELATVGYCGFHFVMMRRHLLERLGDKPFDRLPATNWWEAPLTDIPGRMAEDFSFCHRVRKMGGRIVTERSLITGHVEVADGLMYFPYLPPKIANGSDAPLSLPKGYAYRTRQRGRDYDMLFKVPAR